MRKFKLTLYYTHTLQWQKSHEQKSLGESDIDKNFTQTLANIVQTHCAAHMQREK